MLGEQATMLQATDLIGTWVERGGRYLDTAVALWRLVDAERADAIKALVDRIRLVDHGRVAIRLARAETSELVGMIEGIGRALIEAKIMASDYLVRLDEVAELARRVPEMDARPERTDMDLRHALVEVVFNVEGMARFLAESASENRFVILDGTFYACRIVSTLPDGVECLRSAEALWQVVGEYGTEQLEEIIQEVCPPDAGPHPLLDRLNADALVSNLDLLEEWTVGLIRASADGSGPSARPAAAIHELLADVCRLRDFVREALRRDYLLEFA